MIRPVLAWEGKMLGTANPVENSATESNRKQELLKIIHDAVKNVSSRPEALRGPYIIRDEEIQRKLEKISSDKF